MPDATPAGIQHQAWWDEERQIVRVVGHGKIDEAGGKWILSCTERMAREHGDRIDWLLDLSDISAPNSKARKLIAEACQHPSIRRYAMVGASTFIRVVANFVVAAAGVSNTRHFGTEEEALAWLMEGRASDV